MSVYIPQKLRRRIRIHFDSRCAYCCTAESLTVAIFEIEHILPRSAGGETVFDNLCLACPTCNRYKASRQETADPKTGEIMPFFHPHQQIWEDHFRWSEDATEIIPLTAVARVTVAAFKMNRPQLIRVRRMWAQMGKHPPTPSSQT